MKPPSPHVSAIVVAHDSGPALDRCLRSVRAELDREGLRGEILLVDNASRDGAVHRAADAHTGLVVLRNETNRGFGAAVNQGFRASSGEHVLLLNPDAELAGGALGRLYRTLQDHPRAALAAPRLTLPDGSRQESPRRFYDLGAVLARRTGWGRSGPGQRSAERHVMGDQSLDAAQDVDWVTGAAMLLERDAVPATGPFDERYFLYFEDVDLCRRLHAQGRAVRFEPEAEVLHRFGGGSRRQVPWNTLLLHHLRSAARYAARWSAPRWTSRWWRSVGARVVGVLGRALAVGLIAEAVLGAGLPFAIVALLLLPVPRPARIGHSPLPGSLGPALRLAVGGAAIVAVLEPRPTLDLWLGVGITAALSGVMVGGVPRLARAVESWLRRRGMGRTPCLLAGNPRSASTLARALSEQPDEGLDPLGFVPLAPLDEGGPAPRLRDWSHVVDIARDLRAEAVVVCGPAEQLSSMTEGVHALRRAGVEVGWSLDGAVELVAAEDTHRLAGRPLLALGIGSDARGLGAVAEAAGRVVAGLGLLLLVPLAPLLLIASLVAGRGVPLVAFDRVGRAGRRFRMLRLRTGVGDGPDRGGGAIGALLRATHLDELPQLWNVLVGDMCLVGPRPVDPATAELLEPWERARFAVRPGITGMWQLERLRRWRRSEMITSDLLYILRWSPTLDLRILLETLAGRRNP